MKNNTTSAAAKGGSSRVDLYQYVTDKIIAAIEKGSPPWRKPWRALEKTSQSPVPINAFTGAYYSGINIMLLWLAAEERGYGSNRWLTWRQAKQAGGTVRAGETATLAVVFKQWQKQAEDSEGQKLFDKDKQPVMETIPMLRALYLFNVEQCDGLPDAIGCAQSAPLTNDSLGSVNPEILARISSITEACGVVLEHRNQNRAFYSAVRDRITLPLAQAFFTEADYWATLLHELIHSTGHAKRLNRIGITSPAREFGDPDYAFEELIAEIGCAFLCAELGVYGEVQHDSYVDHWLKVLHEDKRSLFRASRQAREAIEYLLLPPATVAN